MTPNKDQADSATTSDAPKISIAESTATSLQTHCPYRQASLLQQALTPDKMRVAFFLGAGCPVAIRVPNNNGGTNPLIPDIANLTKQVCSKIEASDKHKAGFAAVLKRLSDNGVTNPDVEHILTHVRALGEVIGISNLDGLTKTLLNEIDEEICRQTTDVVKTKLPGDDTPYHHLATWIPMQRDIVRLFVNQIVVSDDEIEFSYRLRDSSERTTTGQHSPAPTNTVPAGGDEPLYIRLPKAGERCARTGMSRSALNALILPTEENSYNPPVESKCLRKREGGKGTRLIVWQSLREYLDKSN